MNDIFERLPNHLKLTRNSDAPEFDRWRLYSLTTGKYLEETGAATPIECIQKYIAIEDKQREQRELVAKQEDIDPEIVKIINDNFWELV